MTYFFFCCFHVNWCPKLRHNSSSNLMLSSVKWMGTDTLLQKAFWHVFNYNMQFENTRILGDSNSSIQYIIRRYIVRFREVSHLRDLHFAISGDWKGKLHCFLFNEGAKAVTGTLHHHHHHHHHRHHHDHNHHHNNNNSHHHHHCHHHHFIIIIILIIIKTSPI